jgi:hypothetical protein
MNAWELGVRDAFEKTAMGAERAARAAESLGISPEAHRAAIAHRRLGFMPNGPDKQRLQNRVGELFQATPSTHDAHGRADPHRGADMLRDVNDRRAKHKMSATGKRLKAKAEAAGKFTDAVAEHLHKPPEPPKPAPVPAPVPPRPTPSPMSASVAAKKGLGTAGKVGIGAGIAGAIGLGALALHNHATRQRHLREHGKHASLAIKPIATQGQVKLVGGVSKKFMNGRWRAQGAGGSNLGTPMPSWVGTNAGERVSKV